MRIERKLQTVGSSAAMYSIMPRRQGVKTDNVFALKWLEKAVSQGEPRAHFNLGICMGEGVVRDKDKARALLRLSTLQEFPIPDMCPD